VYAAANKILGKVVKVTPTSKALGDLALAVVVAKADPAELEANPSKYDIPDSVIAFLHGELADQPGGWPEPFRTRALQGPPAPTDQ
jgi:pyruvate carboxylase